MSSFSRRSMLGGFAVATGAGLLAVPAAAQYQAEIYVPMAPPPPRTEVVPVVPRERVEVMQWQPGYWRWNGYEHVWVEGHYIERPRPRAQWIPGRWEQRPRGWVYIEGHWN